MKNLDVHCAICGRTPDKIDKCYTCGLGTLAAPEVYERVVIDTGTTIKADGGPAEYYDFPEGAITLNDLIEYKNMDFHRGNIFKACWRWGTKSGTTEDYDARKIIYSGARLLQKLAGVDALRETLQKMLDDPQFQRRENEL